MLMGNVPGKAHPESERQLCRERMAEGLSTYASDQSSHQDEDKLALLST